MKKFLLLIALFLLTYSQSYSYSIPTHINLVLVLDDFEDDGGGPPVEDPDPPLPIDKWIPYLMVVGLVYTGYKLSKKKAKERA